MYLYLYIISIFYNILCSAIGILVVYTVVNHITTVVVGSYW